ncbi:MAG: phosphate/phosphite/phosphonate ABC transporter substrate-binding protein [Acidimicrobiia bacterium]|nr:phosphate/phosphite/phosphonate ABC transporter substrate-binding protein [Acidimicrobiia bacterium]
MRIKTWLALLAVCALVVAACGGDDGTTDTTAAESADTAAEETTAETTAADTTMAATTMAATTMAETTVTETTAAASGDVGTADNPISVLFVPSASADEIVTGGELLDQTLEAATGLTFEVAVPTSYGAVIEEMCASPTDTIGMIPAQAYVMANTQCGVEVELAAVRFGSDVYWAQFVVPRDSDAQSLTDLNGATWAYPDPGSTSGYLIPSGMFVGAGVEIGQEVEAGSHDSAMQAVYDGTADVGTGYYTPPSDAEGESLWDGDPANADVSEDLIGQCEPNADGDLLCGEGFQVNDARSAIAQTAPDVVEKVRILTVSDPIPNDTISFSPEFPEDLQEQIITEILAFAENDPEGFATALDAYSWDGVTESTDADFDSIRQIVEDLGLSSDDLD